MSDLEYLKRDSICESCEYMEHGECSQEDKTSCNLLFYIKRSILENGIGNTVRDIVESAIEFKEKITGNYYPAKIDVEIRQTLSRLTNLLIK